VIPDCAHPRLYFISLSLSLSHTVSHCLFPCFGSFFSRNLNLNLIPTLTHLHPHPSLTLTPPSFHPHSPSPSLTFYSHVKPFPGFKMLLQNLVTNHFFALRMSHQLLPRVTNHLPPNQWKNGQLLRTHKRMTSVALLRKDTCL
jgi:hypothetical protein